MTLDRKRPSAAFWATVVVVVALVGYPLSFGPMLWLCFKLDQPDWLGHLIQFAPDPILWIGENGPEPMASWIYDHYTQYISWWVELAE